MSIYISTKWKCIHKNTHSNWACKKTITQCAVSEYRKERTIDILNVVHTLSQARKNSPHRIVKEYVPKSIIFNDILKRILWYVFKFSNTFQWYFSL